MRPREFNIDQVLDAAMQTFWSKGFEAASVGDLCGSMKIGRSSFYQAFGSKHDLLGEALSLYTSRSVAWLSGMLAEQPPFAANIRAILEHFVDEAVSGRECRSCFLGNMAAELSGIATEDSRMVAAQIERVKTIFRAAATQAHQRGELRPAQCPDAVAHFLYAAIQGLRLSIKTTDDRVALMGVVDNLMLSLE